MVVELGDPVYRKAVEEHRRTLPASETGRFCVIVNDVDRALAVYGPYGGDKAVDVAASLESDRVKDEREDEDQPWFEIVPWVDEDPS